MLEASRGAWLPKPSTKDTLEAIHWALQDLKWCECGEAVWDMDRMFCTCRDMCDWGCENCMDEFRCKSCNQVMFCLGGDQVNVCEACEDLREKRLSGYYDGPAYSDDEDGYESGPMCDCGQSAAVMCRGQQCYDCCEDTACVRHNGQRF